MSDIDSNENSYQSSQADNQDLQNSSIFGFTPTLGASSCEGNPPGQLSKQRGRDRHPSPSDNGNGTPLSTRLRARRNRQDLNLVTKPLSSSESKKSSRRKRAPKATPHRIAGAPVGGYRVLGLDAVRHRLGKPIEFKVVWAPTWISFHDIWGEDLFQEAKTLLTEKLGYTVWEEQEGPVSPRLSLDMNHLIEYDSE